MGEIIPPEAEADDDPRDDKIIYLEGEVKRLRSQLLSRSKQSAALDVIVGAIHQSAPAVAPVKPPPRKAVGKEIEIESVVLLMSDLHFGEMVDVEQSGGLSHFNLEIAKKRFEYTVDTAIKIATKKLRGYQFPVLHVFGLGDFISGYIHDELKQSAEVLLIEQVLAASEIIAEGLLGFCQAFREVQVHGVVGNHGRVSEHYYFYGKQINNYDYMIYKMVEKLLARQKNISFDVPKSFWAVAQVENTRFLLIHGDSVRSYQGIPFYGIQRAYLKWRSLVKDYGMDFDHMVMGHFHTPAKIPMGRYYAFINGSLVGGDDFSIGAVSAANDPVQMLFGVHPRKGLTWHFDINSGHIR